MTAKVQIGGTWTPSPVGRRVVWSSRLQILLDGGDGILGAAKMRQHDCKRAIDTGQGVDGILVGLKPSANLRKIETMLSHSDNRLIRKDRPS
jgi:hypothetical protein